MSTARAYAAYTAAIIPGEDGTPTCFSPMKWEELQPEVRQAYEDAATAVVQGTAKATTVIPPQVLSWGAYRAWAHRLKTGKSYDELTPSLRSAWMAFAQQVFKDILKN